MSVSANRLAHAAWRTKPCRAVIAMDDAAVDVRMPHARDDTQPSLISLDDRRCSHCIANYLHQAEPDLLDVRHFSPLNRGAPEPAQHRFIQTAHALEARLPPSVADARQAVRSRERARCAAGVGGILPAAGRLRSKCNGLPSKRWVGLRNMNFPLWNRRGSPRLVCSPWVHRINALHSEP